MIVTDAFVAIDTETTMNAPEEMGKSHPMHPDNRIVAMGWCSLYPTHTYEPTAFWLETFFKEFDTNTIFVGQNISFDLLYLYRTSYDIKRCIQRHRIWDIQLAEHIITGQLNKYASLDDMCIKYRLPLKDSTVTEYFSGGLGADKVPKEILLEYLDGDTSSTLEIAKQQYKIATDRGQLALIWSQMEALHACIEMMYNGLHVDTDILNKYALEVVDKFADSKTTLEGLSTGVTNIDSSQQWSRYFFGGAEKVETRELVGAYKNGKPKYKNVTKEQIVAPATIFKPPKDKISEKTGIVSVDIEVLEELETYESLFPAMSPCYKVVTNLIEYRGLQKQLSTYVLGLGKHLIFDKIHGSISLASTSTGRLTSSSPNLQNISNNEIKKIFTSRFDEGVLVEVDFNQLEIVILAHITHDEQLILDITKGVDIHSELYKELYGILPTKEERKIFKSRTFQLIYGAGAKQIAKMAKCSVADAVKFIETFYTRYPGVKVWHTGIVSDAARFGTHYSGGVDPESKRTFTYKAETGRLLKFQEYTSTKEHSARRHDFSPTELKNYPVQSLATGDIVPMMLGVLFRRFLGSEIAYAINTTHDSVLYDVQADKAVWFMEEVLRVLRDTDIYFHEVFKVKLALQLNASASYGFNWFEMEESKL